eukprot:1890919-Rhodomonas_salina.2
MLFLAPMRMKYDGTIRQVCTRYCTPCTPYAHAPLSLCIRYCLHEPNGAAAQRNGVPSSYAHLHYAIAGTDRPRGYVQRSSKCTTSASCTVTSATPYAISAMLYAISAMPRTTSAMPYAISATDMAMSAA